LKKKKSLITTVFVLTFARFTINMTRRFMYPFVPAISGQLNVSVQSIQALISAQASVGLLSPIFGTISERYGRRQTIVAALAIMVLALFIGVVYLNFWVFAAVMITVGVMKIIYDPAVQAYLGDRIPYNRRGLALGTMELSWAGALIVIGPLAGFLLARHGLQSLFIWFVVMSLVAWVLVWRFLPADRGDRETSVQSVSIIEGFRVLRRNRAGLGAMGFSLFFVIANEIFFINYGVWMDVSFDLTLEDLGFATTVIAAAEVIGEFIVIGFADRVGKRNMALVGTACASMIYLILPHLVFSLTTALIGLFVLFIFVEVAIVSSIPLFTEIIPDARAVMMSGNISAHSLGRLIGGALGGLIYAWIGNFALMGGISMLMGLGACLLMWRFIAEIIPESAF
jgi:predicted MFS family arabinose efflux permease